ncbi:MAG: 50S ribosomal protein L4 [Puniceicoccales bacterium]|jgi:large subunit ribosomal protein L4|nr:50S ribosomal protein L4 [Puniceicoccales bacterium]
MKLKFYSRDWSALPEKTIDGAAPLDGGKGAVALRQCVVAFLANLRQGNACAKDRSEVSGTGKKPYRQKGTGMARHGSKRSPIWSGGGVVFGPKPRDFSQKLNKKIRSAALGRAISDKVGSGEFSLISEFDVPEPKTKVAARLINSAVGGESVLLISDAFSEKFVLASRNMSNVYMVDVNSVNAYDVMRFKNVVVSESAINALLRRAGLVAKEVAE